MLAEVFSHGLIRDFVVAFGTLFNNIKINRRAESGEDSDTIAIPLSYAPQQRYIERITQDLTLDRPVAISLPRMSFEMVSLNYSPERKLNTMQKYHGRRADTGNTAIASMYSPVPYDINFQLSVYISNIEDGTHIVEQILPYFTPEFTVSLKSVTELGLNIDLPIVLNAVNMEDSYEGGFDERRIIIWTLDFTMKAHLFGPVSSSGIINKIMINLHPSTNTAIANNHEQVYITPGQFANGLATNVAALSIDPTLITANSDYGISEQIFGVDEGPNDYRTWRFDQTSHKQTISFGPNAGNLSFDGWETYESDPSGFSGNGYITLTPTIPADSTLLHKIIKTVDGATGNDYQENVLLQIYANSTSDHVFEQFYGKNYQNVTIRFKTKQTVGDGGQFNWNGKFRWLTTDSSELEWSENTNDRYSTESVPSDYSTSAFNTLNQEYQTVNFDLSQKDDWNNRIITGMRFDLFTAIDTVGDAEFETHVDYIKISANTG
tara:strand:+ start:2762 stop:4237 length:1476 start_codon:yes stop_codon:yes gene_type:complete